MRTYDKLESLRGVAACLVAFHHSPFTMNGRAGPFIDSAYLFVDFFFILSGFVMTHAYRERIANGMPFTAYAGVRLARLYPLHVFMHLFYAASILAKAVIFSFGVGRTDPAESVHAPSFWTNLFLLQAFGVHDYIYWNRPSWSISAELGAYVVFFVLTKTLDRAGRLAPPLIGALMLYTGLLVWDDRRLDVTYDFGVIRCLAGFYLGSFLYRLLERRTSRPLAHNRLTRTVAEMAVVAAIAVSVNCVPQGRVFVIGALIAFAVAISLFASSNSGAIGALLETPLLRKLGRWSYSIYLVHLICFETAGNLAEYVLGLDLSRGIGVLAVALDAVTLVAVVAISRHTYEWIENPFRELMKARLTRALRPRGSAAAQ